MSTFTRLFFALSGMILLAEVTPARADPTPAPRRAAGPIAPDHFGKVFRRARPSIVTVRTSSSARAFSIGTLIGAEGELVFGARTQPGDTILVRTPGGEERVAQVLAYAPAIALAVARMEGGHMEALPPASPPDLALDEWVVSVRFNAAGKPEPFAGTVDGTRRFAADPTLTLVDLGTPAELGSPILSANGGVIAFAIKRGERKTSAVLLSSLLPFLRAAVLGK